MEGLLDEAERKYEEAFDYAIKLSAGLEAHPDTNYESPFQSIDLHMTEGKARFNSKAYVQLYSVLLPRSVAESQRLMHDVSYELYPTDSSDELKPELVERKENLERKHDWLMELMEDLAITTKEITGGDLFSPDCTLEPLNNSRQITAD